MSDTLDSTETSHDLPLSGPEAAQTRECSERRPKDCSRDKIDGHADT